MGFLSNLITILYYFLNIHTKIVVKVKILHVLIRTFKGDTLFTAVYRKCTCNVIHAARNLII
jgi:hypothetical protein